MCWLSTRPAEIVRGDLSSHMPGHPLSKIALSDISWGMTLRPHSAEPNEGPPARAEAEGRARTGRAPTCGVWGIQSNDSELALDRGAVAAGAHADELVGGRRFGLYRDVIE